MRAAQLLADLGALEPFQDGWLGASWSDHQSTFNNGRAAITPSFENTATPDRQARQAEDSKGLSQDNIGRFPFPVVEGGAGKITDDFGGLNGWVVRVVHPCGPPVRLATTTFRPSARMNNLLGFRTWASREMLSDRWSVTRWPRAQ